MFKTTLLACAALTACASASMAAPVLVNGGFESSSYASNTEFGTRFGGQGVTGWAGTGYALYFFGGTQATTTANTEYAPGATQEYFRPNVTTSPNGGNFVALDGDSSFQGGTAATPGATISQQVTGLTAGLQYDVSFYWAGTQLLNRSGPTTEQLEVTFGNSTAFTPVVSEPSGGFSGWMGQTYRFTASAASQTLSFLSFGTPSGLPPISLLDGVTVQQSIPEPASWALVGTALLGAGLLATRRTGRGRVLPGAAA